MPRGLPVQSGGVLAIDRRAGGPCATGSAWSRPKYLDLPSRRHRTSRSGWPRAGTRRSLPSYWSRLAHRHCARGSLDHQTDRGPRSLRVPHRSAPRSPACRSAALPHPRRTGQRVPESTRRDLRGGRRPDAAVAAYREAAAGEPDHPSPACNRATCLASRHGGRADLDEAITLSRAAARSAPGPRTTLRADLAGNALRLRFCPLRRPEGPGRRDRDKQQFLCPAIRERLRPFVEPTGSRQPLPRLAPPPPDLDGLSGQSADETRQPDLPADVRHRQVRSTCWQ